MTGWSMVLDNDDGSLSVRRADCALSKISMHKGTSAMLEPKYGNDDEITSLLLLSCSGCAQGCTSVIMSWQQLLSRPSLVNSRITYTA